LHTAAKLYPNFAVVVELQIPKLKFQFTSDSSAPLVFFPRMHRLCLSRLRDQFCSLFFYVSGIRVVIVIVKTYKAGICVPLLVWNCSPKLNSPKVGFWGNTSSLKSPFKPGVPELFRQRAI